MLILLLLEALLFITLVVVFAWSLPFVAASIVALVVVLFLFLPSDQELRERQLEGEGKFCERQLEEMLLRPPPKHRARSTSGISPWGTSGSSGCLPSQRGR